MSDFVGMAQNFQIRKLRLRIGRIWITPYGWLGEMPLPEFLRV